MAQPTHPKQNGEPTVRAPGDDAREAPRLAVGDRVVYASHGIGCIESREDHRADGTMLVLAFENGLRVTLPFDRAQTTLRALSGEPELKEVQRTLGSDSPSAALEHWSRRHRNAQAKLAGGSVSGLAEIVRDGVHRERARLKGGAAPIRSQLYREARKLLVAEVAAVRGIELDAADAWIGAQIDGDPPAACRTRRTHSAESSGAP